MWCLASLPAVTHTAHGFFLPFFPSRENEQSLTRPAESDLNAALVHMLDAVDVMQREYYAPWLGTWPRSIDWTGAVVGTHLSAAMRTLSEALAREDRAHGTASKKEDAEWKLKANLVDSYFSQLTSYYFGENALTIRGEAYDDILWVVLGWLEAVRFVDTHTKLHFSTASSSSQAQGPGQASTGSVGGGLAELLANQTFFGNLWVPPFAHRARVFWELSTHGWDDEYCGGGMTWNPRLLPYKNAITNELYTAASASMYLYFPGDNNDFPFAAVSVKSTSRDHQHSQEVSHNEDGELPLWPPHDPRHLKSAIDAYRWLAASGITDKQGLVIDGFHITGYSDPNNTNTACDERNTQIFTYNQGVVLTGARGLWSATGSRAYLEDGHKLIRNVVKATGWDLDTDRPIGTTSFSNDAENDEVKAFRAQGTLPTFHGLGRMGVMEELCDASATCNQDALTFKGIFFHHLTTFCEPLYFAEPESATHDESARQEFVKTRTMHANACLSYKAWLENNVRAALGTRDAKGRFGMWWTAGLLAPRSSSSPVSPPPEGWPTKLTDGIERGTEEGKQHVDGEQAVDYRNDGVPWDNIWRTREDLAAHHADLNLAGKVGEGARTQHEHGNYRAEMDDRIELKRRDTSNSGGRARNQDNDSNGNHVGDPNSRGWGRTVETQSGGVAVVRAYWNILAQLEKN